MIDWCSIDFLFDVDVFQFLLGKDYLKTSDIACPWLVSSQTASFRLNFGVHFYLSNQIEVGVSFSKSLTVRVVHL